MTCSMTSMTVLPICQYENNSHQRIMVKEEATRLRSCPGLLRALGLALLCTNGAGENGRVTPVNVWCFKPRQWLLSTQANNSVPLKVYEGGSTKEWLYSLLNRVLECNPQPTPIYLNPSLPNSPSLSHRKLLAWVESITTGCASKAIIKSIMWPELLSNLSQALLLSLPCQRCCLYVVSALER